MNDSTDPNLNALWCRAIAEELRRAGVGHVVLCPGSRNSPLLHALHAQFAQCCLSHIDERSASFIALGLARASGTAVAVCVTSGSALANLLPAVVEADAAEVPLIVISADRPWELIGCGAPQAMEQRGVLAPYVRRSLSLGEPTATTATLRALRSQVSRLAQECGGPVHLNVPLRDPLPPLPDATWANPAMPVDALNGRHDQLPFTAVHQATLPAILAESAWLRPGLRGVIVAGCGHGGHPVRAAIDLAARTGFPLLADAPSGLRRPEVNNLVCCGDALVNGPLGHEAVELVIQIGPAPLARAVYEWLECQDCPWIVCEQGRNVDFLARATLALRGDCTGALTTLAARCAPGDGAWQQRWQAAEATARRQLITAMASEPWSETLAAHRAVNHPGFTVLHLASSMAVRYGNLHCPPAARAVFANRGLNGIDGTLGTFLGECRVHGGPGLLLIGDLATLHDLPALAAVRASRARGAIVVLNNDGGGIFDFLTVARMPNYEALVRTPHGMSFAGIAQQFDLIYQAVSDAAALDAALAVAAGSPHLHLIECRLAGGDAVARHRALLHTLAGTTPA